MAVQRKNTVVCMFANDAKQPTAVEIHDFIFYKLRLTEDEVATIQLELNRRRFYVKIKDIAKTKITALTDKNDGVYPFEYENGARSSVKVKEANGLGVRWVRLFYLPDEVEEDNIRKTLSEFGEVKTVREEVWSDKYRFRVRNGIRNVKMELRKHIPSYVNVNGHQAVVIYEDQPRTCAICNSETHFRSECPTKKKVPVPVTYAEVANGSGGGDGRTERQEEEQPAERRDKEKEGDGSSASGTATQEGDEEDERSYFEKGKKLAEARARERQRERAAAEADKNRSQESTSEMAPRERETEEPDQNKNGAESGGAEENPRASETVPEEDTTQERTKEDVAPGDPSQAERGDGREKNGEKTGDTQGTGERREENGQERQPEEEAPAGGGDNEQERESGGEPEASDECEVERDSDSAVKTNKSPSKVDFFVRKRDRPEDGDLESVVKLHAQKYVRGKGQNASRSRRRK